MGGPALTRPAPILYHGLQPRVKPRGVGAPRLIGLGRQGRPRLRTKATLLDHDRGNDAGMSRSVPRADRDGVAGAPPVALRRHAPRRWREYGRCGKQGRAEGSAAVACDDDSGSSTWSEPSANQAHKAARRRRARSLRRSSCSFSARPGRSRIQIAEQRQSVKLLTKGFHLCAIP